jgi:hypothetical protein
MKKIGTLLLLGILIFSEATAQDNAYGVLGGLTVGTQKWNGFDRDPLLTWNGRFFYESLLNERLSVVGEVGLHNRGSGILAQYIIPGTGKLQTNYSKMVFRNVSVLGAAKQVYEIKENLEGYMKLGIRVEYTVADTFDIFEQYSEAIRPFNYGVTFGGGLHFGPKDGPIQFVLDAQVSPDFSQQLYAPTANVWNRYTQQVQTFPEQKVTNLSFEITLGIRFVNKYYYED